MAPRRREWMRCPRGGANGAPYVRQRIDHGEWEG
jgi:hypothetical protein